LQIGAARGELAMARQLRAWLNTLLKKKAK
jgi:hypothetical protein